MKHLKNHYNMIRPKDRQALYGDKVFPVMEEEPRLERQHTLEDVWSQPSKMPWNDNIARKSAIYQLHMIVHCFSPLQIVEDTNFRGLLTFHSGGAFQPVSRSRLRTTMLVVYEQIKEQVKQKLQNQGAGVSIVFGAWSGLNLQSFIGYTCHWIDSNFVRPTPAFVCPY